MTLAWETLWVDMKDKPQLVQLMAMSSKLTTNTTRLLQPCKGTNRGNDLFESVSSRRGMCTGSLRVVSSWGIGSIGGKVERDVSSRPRVDRDGENKTGEGLRQTQKEII
jgi:hypothetical protein